MSSICIHILDDDSLLNIFYLYRLTILGEHKTDDQQIFEGKWVRERWWYKLAHICQRWRSLILGSPSYLNLCLVCTYRTPVADMLAHSPPLPLVIDFVDDFRNEHATSKDEKRILIALQQRDRVRRIRLGIYHAWHLQKLIAAIDEEFPMLEYLYVMHMNSLPGEMYEWILPTTFQAPRLRHLILPNFALPIRSPLLTTMAGLVTLNLQSTMPYFSFSPNDLLQQLSLVHHLQSLTVGGPLKDVNEELLIITHVNLPNLRSFAFKGRSAYLETLLPHITTPLLEKLYISLYDPPALSAPHILQFIITTVNFSGWPSRAVLRFNPWKALVELYPDVGARMYSVCLSNLDDRLNRQVAFAADVLDVLRPVISDVVHLTLEYPYQEATSIASTLRRHPPDRTDWRKVLGAFGNVKTLSMPHDLVKDVYCSPRWDDDKSPIYMLRKLDKLECFGRDDASYTLLDHFVGARRNAGCPVTLVVFEHFQFPNNEILPSTRSPFETSLLV